MFGLGLRQRAKNIAVDIPGVEKLVSLVQAKAQVFQKAYTTQAWGSAESGSGIGSELAATENVSVYLPELFHRLNVSKFLDAPCGDWNWMKQVDLSGVDYIGADVVTDVIKSNNKKYARSSIRFIHSDLTKDTLPEVDLIMCRDCLVHLSFKDIAAILDNFRRTGATWLLVSNTPSQDKNVNKLTGLSWRHLNLRLPPFNFPPEIESRKDHYPDVPFEITLWRLKDIPESILS